MKSPIQIITTRTDFNGDGVIDNLSQTVTTYDEVGNLLTFTREDDYSADGVIDYRYQETKTYESAW
jgi:hypothetical protein